MSRKWLLGIIALAFILRFAALGKFPFGFTADEASFGYDAYSLLKTGKDQWGKVWPLVFESGGDYKAPLYSYLAIPFVAIIGLNKFAVRLPNAMLGTAAVYATYLLAIELKLGKKLEIVSSLLVSVSSWHIMMSRGAFEANLTTFFLPLGMFLLLRGRKNSKYLPWSALVLGLNLFSYHAAKFVTPVLVGFLLIFFRKGFKESFDRNHILAILIFCLHLFAGLYTFTLGAATRAQDVSIFKGALEASSVPRLQATKAGSPAWLARLLHNKYQVFLERFSTNYVSYFSRNFLFLSGPAETSYGMLPGRGVLFWFELPFLLFSIFYIFRKGISPATSFIIAWIFIAPIPAALSTGPGYAANRAVIAIPAVQIFLAVGLVELYSRALKFLGTKSFKLLLGFYLLFSAYLFLGFVKFYFVESPPKVARGMVYGSLEVAQWFVDQGLIDSRIIVSRTLSQPQIYFAFAAKLDPSSFQNYSKNWNYHGEGFSWLDQMGSWQLGSISFGDINYKKFAGQHVYMVGKPEEFPHEVEPVKEIKYPDGKIAFIVVDAFRESIALVQR